MHALYGWPRRHPRLLDTALAIALVSLGGGLLGRSPKIWPEYGIFIVAMVIPIVFRRQHPTGAFLAAVAVGALQVALVTRPVFADVSVLVLLYTLAAYRPRRHVGGRGGHLLCRRGRGRGALAPHRVFISAPTLAQVLLVFTVPIALAWVLGDSMR